jgi:hypothetical protein
VVGGLWAVGGGLWAVGCERWAMGGGLWAVDCGLCGLWAVWTVRSGLASAGCGLRGQLLRVWFSDEHTLRTFLSANRC